MKKILLSALFFTCSISNIYSLPIFGDKKDGYYYLIREYNEAVGKNNFDHQKNILLKLEKAINSQEREIEKLGYLKDYLAKAGYYPIKKVREKLEHVEGLVKASQKEKKSKEISYERQPTRLRVTNNCNFPLWMQSSDNVPDQRVVKLDKNASYDYNIPNERLEATRFWPKIGCDAKGSCELGQSVAPCPPGGCQPPIDSKFEATWAAQDCPVDKPTAECMTWYNASQVDGYTLPFNIIAKGPDVGKFGCVSTDASKLDLNSCPSNEDLSQGKKELEQYKNVDLRIYDKNKKIIGCMAPCKKLNYPAPWGLGIDEKKEPALRMCCPTDPAKLKNNTCTWANECATPEACSDKRDPASVMNTKYVKALHKMTPDVYAYAYDDAKGLHTCTGRTKFELVFCPLNK